MPKTNKNSIAEVEKRTNSLIPNKRHTPDTEVCLVIDGMYIAHMTSHSYKKLSYMGKSTSILFGFPSMLRGFIKQYKPTKIIVCWDGKPHPKRLEVLPGYKESRKKKRDPKVRKRFINQIKKVRRLLLSMGITQAWNMQVEGDDMIYKITNRMQKLYRTIIISGDSDFLQLVNHDVNVYNPRNQQIYSTFAFSVDTGVEIPQYADYKCLMGDETDDIPGYPGIGAVRARKFLAQFYSVEAFLKNKKAEFSGVSDKEFFQEIYERNKTLINLPYFDKTYNKEAEIKYYRGESNPEFNEERFKELCTRYRLLTLMNIEFINLLKK